MSNIVTITKADFTDKRWKKPDNYLFAVKDSICPLTLQEMFKAVLSLPIGFIVRQEKATPVALQGLKPQNNLLVAPDGRWLGRYIPATYRSYPFNLGVTEDEVQLLCIDSDSGCISETEGHHFFTEDQPSQETGKMINFLTQLHQDRLKTDEICSVLYRHNLIQPWSITLKTGENETNVEGLYQIDENLLAQLDSTAFDELRTVGSLPLVYSQLLSMQHLQSLGQLASQQQSKPSADMLDLEQLFGEKDALIKF